MSNNSQGAINLFHALLRSAISTGESVCLLGSNDLLEEVLSIAKHQDVLYLVCHGIKKNNGQVSSDIKHNLIKEVYHYSQNEYMLELAKDVFNKAQIPYMLMKGTILKELYPSPWMRRCCDVDILIHEKDIDTAVQALVESGFITDKNKEYHDVSLYYGIAHLELHFNICENIPRIDNVLEKVWKNTIQKSEYEYAESNEFFAFHIIAHLLYHFLRGGCNIKQYIDLWLLRSNELYDESKLMPLLSMCKLERFYHVICKFTDELFTSKKQTELSRNIEEQILRGGINQQDKLQDNIDIKINGGIGKYVLHYVFLPRREMEWIYPTIKKYPLLLPFYYIKRLFSKTIGKDKERAKEIIKANKVSSIKTEMLLKDIGLS